MIKYGADIEFGVGLRLNAILETLDASFSPFFEIKSSIAPKSCISFILSYILHEKVEMGPYKKYRFLSSFRIRGLLLTDSRMG